MNESHFESRGGDPPCWLDEVCECCGGFLREGHRDKCDAEDSSENLSEPAT